MRITAEDCVLNAVNLWGEVLNVLVSVLLVIHQGLVDDIPAVAEDVIQHQDDHERERQDEESDEDDHDDERHQDTCTTS